MRSTPVSVSRPEGLLDAQLHRPEGGGPRPVVVFYMDAFGLRPALTRLAEWLTGAGYAVLQPNLFYRSGPFAPFDPATTFSDPPERARVQGLMGQVRAVGEDTAALLDVLVQDSTLRTDRVGLVGYCMGGRAAFLAAATLGARAAAMASIHGGGLVRAEPTSPHAGAGRVRARCYFAVADQDTSCTPADVAVLGAALGDAGVTHRIDLYPGARHGFAVDDHPAFDAAAAARHRAAVEHLFATALG